MGSRNDDCVCFCWMYQERLCSNLRKRDERNVVESPRNTEYNQTIIYLFYKQWIVLLLVSDNENNVLGIVKGKRTEQVADNFVLDLGETLCIIRN